MSVINFRSNRAVFVTFDGSCYFSSNNKGHLFCYAQRHSNNNVRYYALNRSIHAHTFNSFLLLYFDLLSLPWIELNV